MKKIILAIAAFAATIPGLSQADKPGMIAARGVDAVVTVRSIDQQARTVLLEGPGGNVFEMQVPPEAQNLDQVKEGSKFNVHYLQSMAVFISPVGGEPAAAEAEAMELAEKGATPAGVIVNVKQVQARVEAIDHDTRTVILTGPMGNAVELEVDERVQRLNEIKAGETVVVRYTEALAMKMIKE